MYGYIKGKLISKEGDFVLLENNNIGYRLFLSPRHLATVHLGEEGVFYTYTSVREDSIILYGFFSMEEVNLFRRLVTVSGIGPKVGLGLMSLAPPSDIIRYITTENMTELTKAPGIGQKTAKRLILELKDKFDYIPEASMGFSSSNDVLEALITLGYSKDEAILSMAEIPSDLPVDKAISLALKQMVRNR